MTEYITDYINPKLFVEATSSHDMKQVVANQHVLQGEILAVFGGRIVHQTQLARLSVNQIRTAIQVDDYYYLAALGEPGLVFNITHCCTPNAGFRGQITLVSMREIKPGEIVSFDYSMFRSGFTKSISCCCGSRECRKQISGQDWQKKELIELYKGFFSPYIQKKINSLYQREHPRPFAQLIPHSFIEPLGTHALSIKLISSSNSNKGKDGVFALDNIAPGELLALWGGVILPFEQVMSLEPSRRVHANQVEENLHQVPFGEYEPADNFNHSCNPNAGLLGQNALVAMRGILSGEEVCFDYAMIDSTPYDEFQCSCGEPNCRKRIKATDWQLPELWKRYEGYFSPYIQTWIDQLKARSGKDSLADPHHE